MNTLFISRFYSLDILEFAPVASRQRRCAEVPTLAKVTCLDEVRDQMTRVKSGADIDVFGST